MSSSESSDGVLCCDYPDLVTKHYPWITCRACGSIWDENASQSKPQRFQSEVPVAEAPRAA
jgi:hypothetical protein